ncbi:MAG: universal stress protein [Thermodesulfovibrionales bacterium]|jgi:nucleotide-binding universal stress UspA family protein
MNGLVCPTAGMEKLMVATDGSDYSESAIREAINLAKVCSSRLFAVSIVTTNLEFETVVPQVMEKDEKEAREHIESIKSRAAKEGIDCDAIVRLSEDPFQDIIDLAEKNKVNMIIIGTHGRTGLKRLMMGSVTAKVIGHSPINVLVVPLHAKVECRNILLATDGSKYSDAAASEAFGIAKKCGSSLFVISVASADTEVASAAGNVKKVTGTAERENIHIEGIAVKGKPYEAIIETAKQKRADLIIMGSHGRTGLERLLMGSVTERVIGHSEVAVLVVKA